MDVTGWGNNLLLLIRIGPLKTLAPFQRELKWPPGKDVSSAEEATEGHNRIPWEGPHRGA
jgi:hypothetical protein